MFLNNFWIIKWYILIQLNYLWADRDHEHVHIKVHIPHIMQKHTHVRTVSKHHFHPKKITKIHSSLNTDIDSSAILPYLNSPIDNHHYISPSIGHSIPSAWNLDSSSALSLKNTKYLTHPVGAETDWNSFFPNSGKFYKPINQLSKYQKLRPNLPVSYNEDFLFKNGQQFDEDKLIDDDSIESESHADIKGFDEIHDSYTVSSYNNPKWIPTSKKQLSYTRTKGNNWQPQTMMTSNEWDDNLPSSREPISSEYHHDNIKSYYGKFSSPGTGLMDLDLINSESVPPTTALAFNDKIRNIKKNKWSKKKIKSNRNRYQNRMKF